MTHGILALGAPQTANCLTIFLIPLILLETAFVCFVEPVRF